jgi:hypothetical protein
MQSSKLNIKAWYYKLKGDSISLGTSCWRKNQPAHLYIYHQMNISSSQDTGDVESGFDD